MELYAVVAVCAAYFGFVFSSELMNPFAKPRTYYSRKRWHHGRRIGLAGLLGSALFAIFHGAVQMSLLNASLIGFGVFAVAWVSITKVDKAQSRI